MFMGQAVCTIDDKSRLTIPAKFRTDLGETFVITGGLDSCLFVYTSTQWAEVYPKIKAMDSMKADVRAYQRYFLSNATQAELDKQGRVLVPGNLRQLAHLDKECLTIGSGDRLEIWNKARWDEYIAKYETGINDLAEGLSGLF
jgi:MraZ protein